MKVQVCDDSEMLAQQAANQAAEILTNVVATQGSARLLLSTGASQLGVLKALAQTKVQWNCIEVFHLDEYIGIPASHPASFRKYIKERFVNVVHPQKMYYVDGDGDIQRTLEQLSKEVQRKPIDLALIGIGENAHIAFNDPPANFETERPYITVQLDEDCKFQQVREGWFESVADVPSHAITMTPLQILQSRVIISCVPYEVKANAIKRMLKSDVTNQIPATILKRHKDVTLYLDHDSASLIDEQVEMVDE